MKTYILSIPDDADDPAVRTALADLLARRVVVLEPEPDNLLSPVSAEDFAADLRAALTSPVLSAAEAQAYLNL